MNACTTEPIQNWCFAIVNYGLDSLSRELCHSCSYRDGDLGGNRELKKSLFCLGSEAVFSGDISRLFQSRWKDNDTGMTFGLGLGYSARRYQNFFPSLEGTLEVRYLPEFSKLCQNLNFLIVVASQ